MSSKLSQLRNDALVALIPPVVILFIHSLRVATLPGLYQADYIMHFSGGLSIAWMAMILWNRFRAHGWIPKNNPLWLRNLTVWGSVALVGVGWELFEYIMSNRFNFAMQFTIGETMGDLALDLAGGLAFLVLFRFRD